MPTREQLTVCPIKRVGYFHFGADNKEHPVESLKAALELQGGLGDCLLVLPEAFNVASGYYCGQLPDQLIEAALQELSFTKGVAFVVSLIAPDVGSSGNCNSAVVIDGKSILMLSKKRTSIRRELDGECVFGDVQIVHRGLRIAALICDDAANCDGERRFAIEDDSTSFPTVLCIPAYMTLTRSELVVQDWGKLAAIVLANGDHRQPSIIRIKAMNIVAPDGRRQNLVELEYL